MTAPIKPYKEAFADFFQTYWHTVLQATDNKIGEAARLSGVNRTHVYKKLKMQNFQREKKPIHRGRWGD